MEAGREKEKMKNRIRRKDIPIFDLKSLEKDAAVICRDFVVFCNYILENKVKLSKKTGNIGKKDCFVLNNLMDVREKVEKPSYFQSRYSILNFFYYVGLKYKILEIDVSGTGFEKGINYQCFIDSPLWEKYMLFLVVALYDGTFAKRESGGYYSLVSELWNIYIDSFMEWAAKEKPQTGGRYRVSSNSGIHYFYEWDLIVPYLEELHMIRVHEQFKADSWENESWKEIEMLPLLNMVSTLYEKVEYDENTYKKVGLDVEFAVQYHYEAFMGVLPQEKEKASLLKRFEDQDMREKEQVIDLEVSVRYTDCIRVIRMNSESSLYELHSMIQRAVDFDDDHLFCFYIGSGMMRKTYELSEFLDSNQNFSVEETALGELGLRKGKKFTYLFDYGDRWLFDIKVLNIEDGFVEEPEIIRAKNAAPEQYPVYEEDMDGWEVEVSDRVQPGDILLLIDDEFIVDEYAALAGEKSEDAERAFAKMRHGMEGILLREPDKMLAFMPAEMREQLLELLEKDWISEEKRCSVAKLYSFGFCRWAEEGDRIQVPEIVKEIYASKLKVSNQGDKVTEAAERLIKRCGVMEMRLLHSAVAKVLESDIPYEDFRYMIYSRLHYFGRYYCDGYDGTEYMSCYDRKLTERILKARRKPENMAFEYPDFSKIDLDHKEGFPEAVENWNVYVSYNLGIGRQFAESLAENILSMAASGVFEADEVIAVYKDMLREIGKRAAKTAESLIAELCRSLPLASRKGN